MTLMLPVLPEGCTDTRQITMAETNIIPQGQEMLVRGRCSSSGDAEVGQMLLVEADGRLSERYSLLMARVLAEVAEQVPVRVANVMEKKQILHAGTCLGVWKVIGGMVTSFANQIGNQAESARFIRQGAAELPLSCRNW